MAASLLERSSKVAIGLLLGVLAFSPRAAEGPAPGHVCGNGTFTVDLPVATDPSGAPVPTFGGATAWGNSPDSVTLPKGCRIYALLVSGYGSNRQLNELTFYRLASFVARNGGYVHWAWWNNLLREYAGGPLHDQWATVPSGWDLFGRPTGYTTLRDSPGTDALNEGFRDPDRIPKAMPNDDLQFQADAARMLRTIREQNPDAIIIVAGHSMGGGAVARLGANTDVDIDLLAPIDPVGNRTEPLGGPGKESDLTFNWTRWRATHEFKGYKAVDCVRDGPDGLTGSCRDFRSNWWEFPQYRCQAVGEFFPHPGIPGTVFGSKAWPICWGPATDPGTTLTFRPRVRRLYYRWQTEALFPFDFGSTEHFSHWGERADTPDLSSHNIQAPFLRNDWFINFPDGEGDANKTCAAGKDPRAPAFACSPIDGHGEIIGYRGRGADVVPLGTFASQWPASAAERRTALLELAWVDPWTWDHRPANPELCMVSDDLIALTGTILDERPSSKDDAPPITIATLAPAANAAGWNHEPVVASLSASDAGTGVKRLEYLLYGAQNGSWVVEPAAPAPGVDASVVVTEQGTTTLDYYAIDGADNVAPTKTSELKIDRTPPLVEPTVSPPANAAGWHATDVEVRFLASDGLSGVQSVTGPVLLTTEGAGQPISGSAIDFADNQTGTEVRVSIDKTAPTVGVSVSPPLNADGWSSSPVTVTFEAADTLSGVAEVTPPFIVSAEGASQVVAGSAADRAGNRAHASATVSVDRAPPSIAINAPADGSVYLLGAAVQASYRCADALSGIRTCVAPVPNGAPIDTSSVGARAFRVDASDVAGNAATRTHGYAVAYGFGGFLPPVSSPPAVNAARAGSTVPIKWRLRDANGTAIQDLGAVASLSSASVSCDALDNPGGDALPAAAAGGTSLRIDDGQFLFNWQTSREWTGCRRFDLRLADGTIQRLAFRFR